MKKRTIALLLACMMVVGVAAGGTIAWLTAKTDSVVNTFTIGNITLNLAETDDGDGNLLANAYKLSPGGNIAKDPVVTVGGNSEACYLFIRVDEANTTVDTVKVVDYAIADGWTLYKENGADGIPTGATFYYKTGNVAASADAQSFEVLACKKGKADTHSTCKGCVDFPDTITEGMIQTINTTNPKLTFTAAAIQQANLNTIDAAWAALPAAFTGIAAP